MRRIYKVQHVEQNTTSFVSVSDRYSTEDGRKIAFRFVYQRPEKSFPELAKTVTEMPVTDIGDNSAEYALTALKRAS